jgi:hypothetical protein
MLTAFKTFDSTAGGITVGIIILVIALGFGSAACMDLLLISKVNLQNGELYIVISVVDHTMKGWWEGEALR